MKTEKTPTLAPLVGPTHTFIIHSRLFAFTAAGECSVKTFGTPADRFVRAPVLDIKGGISNVISSNVRTFLWSNSGEAFQFYGDSGQCERTDENIFGFTAPVRSPSDDLRIEESTARLHAMAAEKRRERMASEQAEIRRAEQVMEAHKAAIEASNAELAERRKALGIVSNEYDGLAKKAGKTLIDRSTKDDNTNANGFGQ